ncbi:low molecular weight protein-tyrosine-phosphatase [Chelativorans sp. AA-79]|uniref:low molecular weight protein-tyrosine-phosphatase n=1 Tax=Chelativorans sp. AA-79 TaxID=3028735 RepID=UPI0023F84A33|nr:low molecular weight protein-tyrosine-phosphatase [Chelativorans sp. AA-79]WEX09851.1 low molecular weight phosphotyrosine protein phosphatase [Chelativorans sp. AA-79]
MTEQPRTAILFVCLGNICRSPLAEGIFRSVVAERGLEDRFEIDSAALGDWHVGHAPDPRSVAVARRYDIDISSQRGRQVGPADFARFDLIFGMDRENVRRLCRIAPPEARKRIHLFLDYALGRKEEVPDPYYEGEDSFAAIYWTIREASEALAARLAERPGSARRSGQASSIT